MSTSSTSFLGAFRRTKPRESRRPDNNILFPCDNSTSTLSAQAYLRDVANLCSVTARDVSLENVITKVEYYAASSPIPEEILSVHVAFFDGVTVHPTIDATANFHFPIPADMKLPRKSSHNTLSRTSLDRFTLKAWLLAFLSLKWLPLQKFHLPSLIASSKRSHYATDFIRVYPTNTVSWRHGLQHLATMDFPEPDQSRVNLERVASIVDFARTQSSSDGCRSSVCHCPLSWAWNAIAEVHAEEVLEHGTVTSKPSSCFSWGRRCCSKRTGRVPLRFEEETLTAEHIDIVHEAWRKQAAEFELRSKERNLRLGDGNVLAFIDAVELHQD